MTNEQHKLLQEAIEGLWDDVWLKRPLTDRILDAVIPVIEGMLEDEHEC